MENLLIAEHVRRLLESMGIADSLVSVSYADEEVLRITIMAHDTGSILIGAQGAHLFALQYIIRCVLRKHLDFGIYIVVDVNGYRIRRERSLMGLAEEVARRAVKTGHAVALEPMSAVDRRAIHTALATHKDIATESHGDGALRRVVVRPVFL